MKSIGGLGVVSWVFIAHLLVHGVAYWPSPDLGVAFHFSRVVWAMPFAVVGLVMLRSEIAVELLRLPGALIGLIVLGVVSVLALGTDPDGSYYVLMGTDSRFDGAVFYVSLSLILLAHIALSRSFPVHRLRVANSLVTVGVFQSLVMVGQRLGLDPVLGSLTGAPQFSVFGTTGHMGFSAAMVLVAMPWALHRLADAAVQQSGRGAAVWSVASLSLIFGIAAAGNRTLIVAAAVMAVAWVLMFRRSPHTLVGLGGFTLAALLVFAPPLPVATIARPVDETLSTRTLETRLVMWRIAARAIARDPLSPWIGRGSDGFRVQLHEYLSPEELFEFYAIEFRFPEGELVEATRLSDLHGEILHRSAGVVFVVEKPDGGREQFLFFDPWDKAHNAYIDLLLSFGIAGLGGLLALLALPILRLAFGFRAAPKPARVWVVAVIGVSVYFMTWFITVPTGLPTLLAPVLAALFFENS